MRTESFKAKVKMNGDTYHIWRETDNAGLFVAICNPGLTRANSELFEVKGRESLCKVCQQHQGAVIRPTHEKASPGNVIRPLDKNTAQLIELIQVMFGAINDRLDALERRLGVSHEI